MQGSISVNRIRTLLASAVVSTLLAGPVIGVMAQDATPAADNSDVEIAYVLHGLNAFTERIKTGAEDAGRDYGVTVEVFGDASFDTPTHQAFFDAAMQRGFDGIAVIPLPGDQWITPIQQANDAGIPLVGANITALETGLTVWVGQDEYNSGVILGEQMIEQLEKAGKTEGKIAVGICSAAATALQDRDNGLRQAFEGSAYEVLPTQEVLIPVPDNYGRWENFMAANPDAVAAIGLCSIDIPNLAQLKERTGGEWLIGGYDLDPPTLQAIKDGWAAVTVGQQEYLQGYLPVRALAEHLVNGTPMVEGWLEGPTEVVTIDNVDAYVSRQTDNQVQWEYYQEYMDEHFADLQESARPYQDLANPGMPRATPES
jgi:simple sugar transport system substrate-binding protein